ncbi:Bcr/CflA family multidrug efflux MFS transporter [Flindersiella endophytica]
MPSPSARPTPKIAPLVLLLGTITAIGPMSIDLYLPAFPTLTRELSTSESMVQLTLTACLVGLAVGQILVGPLSDAIGRRKPLLVGMSLYSVASLVCAFAPTIEALTFGRFLQGLAGSAGAVLSQALLRDLVEGPMVARVMSRLILVIGVAPVLAPTLGGQLLTLTGWRGLFWVLTAFGVVLTMVVTFFVRETLPVERRVRGGLRATVGTYRRILADKVFLAYAAISTLGFVMIFGYVSGSPFAYQEVHGVSPQTFGLLFGLNAVGMVITSQLNAWLVLRISPQTILTRAVPMSALAALSLLFTTSTGLFGLAGLAAPLFVLMSSIGLVLSNSGASALNQHPESAGSAAAFVGMSQFVIGAFAGPLIGIAGTGTAVPMAAVITFGALGMLTIALLLRWRKPAVRVPAAGEPVAEVLTH